MGALVTIERERIVERVLPVLRSEPALVAAYLFGSALERCRPDSDVDIGIIADCASERERERLEARLASQLKPLDAHPFDVVVLNADDVYFPFRVVREGTLVHVADSDRLGDFIEIVSRRYGELAPRRRQAMAEILGDLRQ